MSSNPQKTNKAKDFDFDNIFDETKSKIPEQIPTSLFESFGQTEQSTVKGNDPEPQDFFNQDFQNQPNEINSLPSSSKDIIKNKNEFSSNHQKMVTRNSLAVNNQIFNDFDFNPNKSLSRNKNKNPNFFDIDNNQNNQKTLNNQDLDIDLMGLNLQKDILQQDIQNLDKNLFKKNNTIKEQFGSNNPDNTFFKKKEENNNNNLNFLKENPDQNKNVYIFNLLIY